MLHRGDNRIQDYSTKNRPVFGLGSSFGEPQTTVVEQLAEARVKGLAQPELVLESLQSSQTSPVQGLEALSHT